MNAPASEAPRPSRGAPASAPAVLFAAFTIGTCGLVYELLAGTLASYVLGDSVTQFSTIIGVYLFAMGLGAGLSSLVERELVRKFVEVEIAVALVGGASAAILFLAFAELSFFRVVLYGLVLLVGALVGLEIPLLMRILKDQQDLKDLVSRVLAVDYLGALVASLAFPLFIVPELGLVRGAFAVGCVNAAVGIWCTHVLRDALRPRQVVLLRVQAWGALGLLAAGFALSDRITSLAEDRLYADPVVFARTTHYQRIVVTRGRGAFQLYLNGNLQLTSADEHRYHEALVHPAAAALAERGRAPRRALVLGGGDGLAVRELRRHAALEDITLVELDPEMIALARTVPMLAQQNGGALDDPRVEVVLADAMVWLADPARTAEPRWDLVIVDFPDPNSFSLGKLYTTRFYRLARRVLADDGFLVVQATSPLYARRSFWCVERTIAAAGFETRAYHVAVPSFGEWGYVLASPRPFDVPGAVAAGGLRFLTPEVQASLFAFPGDMAPVPAEVNRLDHQVLVQYYEDEWGRFN